MDWTYARLFAHTLLIVEAMTAAYMVWLAREQAVRLVHVGYAISGLALIALWLVGLVGSARSVGPIPRELLIPLLASLELGAGVMFGAWLVAMYRSTFTVHVSAKDRVAAIIIAFVLLGVG